MVIVNNLQRLNTIIWGISTSCGKFSSFNKTCRLNNNSPQASEPGYLRALALIENKALLLQQNQLFYLMSLAKLQTLNYELTLQQSEISQQPLLIPIIFRLDEKQI